MSIIASMGLSQHRYFPLIFLLLFVTLASPIRAQVLTDPDAAFASAHAAGKPVLLVFSGSDWCAPCIRFEREVLTDSTFLRYARPRVVILKADFPQRKQLAKPLQTAYEKLADAYNPDGIFPKLLLIGGDRKTATPVPFRQQTAAAFVADLQRILN
jgi:thiol-disulfide isomerase/thioredoxin